MYIKFYSNFSMIITFAIQSEDSVLAKYLVSSFKYQECVNILVTHSVHLYIDPIYLPFWLLMSIGPVQVSTNIFGGVLV